LEDDKAPALSLRPRLPTRDSQPATRLLAIGTDASLVRPAERAFGDAHQRQLAYARILDEYRIVVRTLGGDRRPIRHAPNFVVHPSASRGRGLFPGDAFRLGGALHRRLGFDLVSTEDPLLCGLAGYALARRFGLPFSAQIAGDMLDNPYWLRERRINPALNVLGKWLVRRADSVRVVSERERAKLLRLGVPPERVRSIGWITDFARFEGVDGSELRERLLDGGRYLLLFMGRLVPQKDLATLLRATARIVGERREVRLAIAGDGPQRASAERLAHRLGLGDRVTFLGTVPYPDVPRHYAASDLVLLPSRYEGNARVLAEAGAAGKPVVTTDVSGARDTILGGETGHVVPVGHPDLLAERTLALLADPTRLREMGGRAREHVRRLYDQDVLLTAFAEFWAATAR
jgi:glycosyltransferase involved in cell wall biosynthesis